MVVIKAVLTVVVEEVLVVVEIVVVAVGNKFHCYLISIFSTFRSACNN